MHLAAARSMIHVPEYGTKAYTWAYFFHFFHIYRLSIYPPCGRV